MDYKECTKCGRLLPISEFGPHKFTRDGLQSWCKECTSKNIEEGRRRNPEKTLEQGRKGQSRYRERHPEKIKAQLMVRGTELAPFCEQCGTSENLERHHPDYSKPREYMTLCKKCHLESHGKKERT